MLELKSTERKKDQEIKRASTTIEAHYVSINTN